MYVVIGAFTSQFCHVWPCSMLGCKMPTPFNTVHSWHWILWDNKVFSLNDLFAFEGFPAVPDEPRTRTTSLGNSVIPLVVQDLCRLACSDGRSYYRLFNTTKSTSEYDNATLPEQPAEKSINV
jgi:hypothetical protein